MNSSRKVVKEREFKGKREIYETKTSIKRMEKKKKTRLDSVRERERILGMYGHRSDFLAGLIPHYFFYPLLYPYPFWVEIR